MKTIESIIRIDSNTGGSCPFSCGFYREHDKFADAVNHMIQAHGCTVEHIGQESMIGGDGAPYQMTVAVLANGK